jgi:hypothetical protein
MFQLVLKQKITDIQYIEKLGGNIIKRQIQQEKDQKRALMIVSKAPNASDVRYLISPLLCLILDLVQCLVFMSLYKSRFRVHVLSLGVQVHVPACPVLHVSNSKSQSRYPRP